MVGPAISSWAWSAWCTPDGWSTRAAGSTCWSPQCSTSLGRRLYVWARREVNLPVFTKAEWVVVGVVVVTSIVAVVLMATGNLAVL